jgi:hypothetical protein
LHVAMLWSVILGQHKEHDPILSTVLLSCYH